MNIRSKIAIKLYSYDRRKLLISALTLDLLIFAAGCALVYYMVGK